MTFSFVVCVAFPISNVSLAGRAKSLPAMRPLPQIVTSQAKQTLGFRMLRDLGDAVRDTYDRTEI
jgi:hypothetical protein